MTQMVLSLSKNNPTGFSSKVVEKVAIIGAGIGGLATAIALRKQGIDAQVYDKARSLRSVGAGLSLFPNGLDSLNAIKPGIVESLKLAGSQTHIVNVKKSTGETIARNRLITLREIRAADVADPVVAFTADFGISTATRCYTPKLALHWP